MFGDMNLEFRQFVSIDGLQSHSLGLNQLGNEQS